MIILQSDDVVRSRMKQQIEQRVVNSGQYFGGKVTAHAWVVLSVMHPQRDIASLSMIQADPRPFVAVDLGPGSGESAVRVLRGSAALQSVVGVDTSSDMLTLASAMVSSALWCQYKRVVADFVRDAALLREQLDSITDRKVLLCLGGTIGNYPQSFIFSALNQLLGEDDWLLIGAGTYSEHGDPRVQMQSVADFFRSEENCRFGLQWLCACGCVPNHQQIRMVIERDVRHAGVWVVRGYYGFAADTHFNILGDDIEVPAGAEIQWVESRRYSPRSVPNLLARYGLQLLEEQQFSGHGLYLCQRAR